MVLEGTIYKVCSGDSSPPSHQQQQSIFQTLLLMQSHLNYITLDDTSWIKLLNSLKQLDKWINTTLIYIFD